jgi:hypothetical protein
LVAVNLSREAVSVARNRCTFEKRAKEIARKQKQEEKLKRRQNKIQSKAEDEEENFTTEDNEPGSDEIADESYQEHENVSEQPAISDDGK